MTFQEIRTADILNLSQRSGAGPRVSLFASLGKGWPEVRENRTIVAGLVHQLEQTIDREHLDSAMTALLVGDLKDILSDPALNAGLSEGIAVFAGPEDPVAYRVPCRVSAEVVIGRRYVTRPLLPLLWTLQPVFVLAVARGAARMFRVEGSVFERVEVADMPPQLDALLQFEVPEITSSSHSLGNRSTGGVGAVFHGHGGRKDGLEHSIREYTHQIASAVDRRLQGETTPLLLAGSADLATSVGELLAYRRRLPGPIRMNPEYTSESEMKEEIAKVLETWRAQQESAARSAYREKISTGHTATHLQAVLPAAHAGRVAVGFVASDAEVWGYYDARSGVMRERADSGVDADDLVDLAASLILQHGGVVHTMPLSELPEGPAGGPVQVLLRG